MSCCSYSCEKCGFESSKGSGTLCPRCFGPLDVEFDEAGDHDEREERED